MRKRLIQKFTKSKEGTLGYTLTEMLVVIAIIAILVAIAIPSVVAISRALKFKRLNDHAKSIFMAAQQNLTDMRSDGELSRLQKGKIDADHAEAYAAVGAHIIPENVVPEGLEGYIDEYVYTFTGEDAFNLILPAGSVDATVLSEDIVIEFNPFTGNVFAVFYSEEEGIADKTAYDAGLPRDKDTRNLRMLGYYEGDGLNSSSIDELKTQAEISYIDGEEGIVQVRIPVDRAFYSRLDLYARALSVQLTITGEYSREKAPKSGTMEDYTIVLPIKDTTSGLTGETVKNNLGATCTTMNGNTIVLEYVIDSLVRSGSFANHSAGKEASLTTVSDESEFSILPGENISIRADVTVDVKLTNIPIEVEPASLFNINPMFAALSIDDRTGAGILNIANGRHLQNLNAIAPTMADLVERVQFTDDIYWNETVAYYNNKYGSGETYHNRTPIRDKNNVLTGYAYDEAPARALPYFVPIHNAYLFGTAEFIYPGDGDKGYGGWLDDLLEFIDFDGLTELLFGGFNNADVPTLTDELDNVRWKLIKKKNPQAPAYATSHAKIQGQNHKVYNLNIDSNLYAPPIGKFYTDADYDIEVTQNRKTQIYNYRQTVDYHFTGLFGYVNTSIRDLSVVNPVVKGHVMDLSTTKDNPATGALVGAAGWDTLLTNCGVYIDKLAPGYNATYLTQQHFNADAAQNWYGVSGHGAVGGLMGYAKSHHSVTGELGDDEGVLSFYKCFAAVPVSGVMRKSAAKDFGYSNGVGGFIGNSQLTNFYACYASGNVYATNCHVISNDPEKENDGINWSDPLEWIAKQLVDLFGGEVEITCDGRISWGAGGFAGTSHGTRYTNCFATGDVTATAAKGGCGAGGFVGFMSIDETSAYGNTVKMKNDKGETVSVSGNNNQIVQRTVFTNCYAVGQATTNGTNYENFSGANGRIVFDIDEFFTYFIGDYYRLYAPYKANHDNNDPEYDQSAYIYRDTYYLNYGRQNVGDQDASRTCAEPVGYNVLQKLHDWNGGYGAWAAGKLETIKNINTTVVEYYTTILGIKLPRLAKANYQKQYFSKYPSMEQDYVNEFREAFPSTYWVAATPETTHAYTVASGGVAYPFSMLAGMEYYGDWPATPSGIGMAYYEIYEKDITANTKHYIFDKERTEQHNTMLKNGEDVNVVEDGYAILSSEKYNNIGVTIFSDPKQVDKKKVNTNQGTTFTLRNPETVLIGGSYYYAYTLPNDALEIQPEEGFYVAAYVTVGSTSYWMYYNPNVAMSHVSPMDGATDPGLPTSAPKLLYVRSARQFKGLSNLDDFLGEGTKCVQELNIDAAKYGDYCDWDTADYKLDSIGSAENPFNGTYSAGYTAEDGTAKQYSVSGFQLNAGAEGIFAAVGSEGGIENLIVNTGAIAAGGNSVTDVAVLAGRNEGGINNVDLTAADAITLTAKNNAGVLVGYNSGTVRDCEVSAAAVNLTAKNCGGLIGSTNGITKEETVDDETVQYTENSVVTDCTLTMTGALTMTGKLPAGETAGNTFAGGLIGYGEDLTLSVGEPAVFLADVTEDGVLPVDLAARADFAGGLAGYLGETDISVADSSDAPVVQITGTLSNVNGYAAGFLGKGENVTTIGMNVVANSVSGAQAAGFLGTGTGMNVTNSNVVIGTAITGDSEAAGVACTIGGNSKFENVPVSLAGVTVSASDEENGKAAGYAVEITANADVRSSVVTLGGEAKISGGAYAAGYAYSIGGFVGRYNNGTIDPAVVGKGAISAMNAAGFACQITNQVVYAHVTPALNLDDYKNTNNGNLTVTGEESAAGFVLDVSANGVVDRCHSLNTVSAPKASGFAITNMGTIHGSTSNATITGGYAFVEKNEGTVRRCYGWYGDGATAQTTTVATVDGGISSYFADLDPVDPEGVIAVLYPADGGAAVNMTAIELQESINVLSDASNRWFNGGYDEYPYAAKLQGKDYLYPMLDDHFGDWFVPPKYAFGIAYYETYLLDSKEMLKIHMVDLSDNTQTEEGVDISTFLVVDGENVTMNPSDAFKNEGVIQSTGYAVFGKKNQNVLQNVQSDEVLFTYALKHEQSGKTVEYTFYKMDTSSADQNGRIEVESALMQQGTSATINVHFADAINANGTYYVRTPEQLAKTNAVKANFIQSHDIAVTDFTNMTLDSSYTYEGMYDSKLSVSQQASTWMTEVAGTVKTLKIEVTGGVNKPIFGTVTGSVSLNGIDMDTVASGGAVAETVGTNGSVTVPGIETDAVAAGGKLFGDSTGTIIVNGNIAVKGTGDMLFGDVEGGSVTVDGNISVATTVAHTGKIFGSVKDDVEVTGKITTGDLSGQIFGAIELASDETVTVNGITVGDIAEGKSIIAGISGAGTINTGNVTVDNVNGQVFGPISGGELQVGELSAQAVGTAEAPAMIFGEISGGNGVTATSITAGNVYGQVFGDVGAAVTVNGDITTGTITGFTTAESVKVNGQIFGDVSAQVSTGAITVEGDADQIFGDVKADVTVSGNISTVHTVEGETTYGVVDQVFGVIDLNAEENVTVGGINLGDITSEKGLVVSVGTETDANAGTVSLGVIDVEEVGTSEKNTHIVGNIYGGSVTATSITAGNVYGNVFGDVNGAVTVGTEGNTDDAIKTGTVTKVFGTVSGNGVTINGKISAKKVNTQVFGDATANIKTDDIDITGTAGNVFGSVTDAETGNITVGAAVTNVFGDVNGTVTVGTEGNTGDAIKTGTVTNVFGDVSGNSVTINGKIHTGEVKAQVFGDVSAKTVTLNGGIASGKVQNIMGNVSKDATVTTGEISASSLSGKLAGTVAGTLQGHAAEATTVDLGSTEMGNLVTGVSGTVKNISVTSTGDMSASLIGGTLAGTLDNVDVTAANADVGNSGGVIVGAMSDGSTIEDCDVVMQSVGADGEMVYGTIQSTAPVFGGITSVAKGDITDCSVVADEMILTAEKLDSGSNAMFGGIVGQANSSYKDNNTTTPIEVKNNQVGSKTDDAEISMTMSVAGKASSMTVVGGIVGENNASVEGGSAYVNINYTQASPDKLAIGGLVGWMKSGELSGTQNSTDVTGTLELSGTNASGRSGYYVGGAVGYDGDVSSDAGAVYSDVTADVELVGMWAGSSVPAKDPYKFIGNSYPVGMFVGFVTDGNFQNCGSTSDSADYEFLGQVRATTGTLDAVEGKTWFSYTTNSADMTVQTDEATSLGTVAEDNGFKTVTDGYTKVDVSLDGCTFVESGKTYTQTLDISEYFYLGQKKTEKGGQQLNEVKMKETTTYPPVTNDSIPKYKDLYDAHSSTTNDIDTGYYAFHNNQYVPVYLKVEVKEESYWFWTYNTYTYIFRTADGTQLGKKSNAMQDSDREDRVDEITLYTASTTKSFPTDGKYLITNTDGTYFFNGKNSSNAVGITTNDKGYVTNTDLVLWTIDSNGYWKTGSTYLELYYNRGSWGSSTTNRVVHTSGRNITVKEMTNGFSLHGRNQYLTFSSNAFRNSDSSSSTIKLWTVAQIPDEYFCVFTYDDTYVSMGVGRK